ncbi:oxidoreductase [Mycena rebaudengoi]|nr:oxidoreductase [Mycena rebaudengoi]
MSRVVLITGCSAGGIGYSLCEHFAQSGCIVYASARRLESMAGFNSPLIKTLTLDVTNGADVRRVVAHVVEDAGKIDIVVNNAGAIGIGPLIEQPMDNVLANFDTNTHGALRVAQAVFPHMAERRSGLIVNVGSVVAEISVPWNGLYSAAKAAMHSMSEILSMELKPFNISVMYIAPGSVRSNIANNSRFSLQPGSRYTAFLPNIIQRQNASQGPTSMPADIFAATMVRQVLNKKPPRYLMLGGNTRLFAVLKWLPRSVVLWYMWRLFSRRT